MNIVLRECFSDPLLDAMNFLNEVTLDYPKAISFAPGRPPERLFGIEEHLKSIDKFVAEQSRLSGLKQGTIWQQLGQYNRTNGIIGELIAKHLEKDEGIHVATESIMVTVGAQEAMAILLAGLFKPDEDVLLSSDPTYIGITALARVFGVRVEPVPSGEEGLDPQKVEQAIVRAGKTGRVRAIYDIPDFNNPLGTTLSMSHRKELIEICHKHGVFIIEDNPYGMFIYDGDKMQSLKALDKDGVVIYIGSFSKTLFPGLRLGYLVADQLVEPSGQILAKELSKVKSLLTVNTSPLLQAIVGALLKETGGSLESVVRPKIDCLHRNRDAMLKGLSEHFHGLENAVRWNQPRGGFFITVNLPFRFGRQELKICAEKYGVIVCPMSFFMLGAGREFQVRLSFSYVEEGEIFEGLERLAKFVRFFWREGAVTEAPT